MSDEMAPREPILLETIPYDATPQEIGARVADRIAELVVEWPHVAPVLCGDRVELWSAPPPWAVEGP